VNGPEEEAARIHAQRIPQPTIGREQRSEKPAHEAWLCAYCVENLLMKQITRGAALSERCHAALFQAARNSSLFDLIEVNNPRSDDCGYQRLTICE